MYASRLAASRYICNACREASIPKTPIPASIRNPHVRAKPFLPPRRTFSSTVSQYKETHDLLPEDPDFAFLDNGTKPSANTQKSTPAATKTSTNSLPSQTTAPPNADASIPWYLRQQSSMMKPQNPAEIPDLPPNPPPLLETILEYVSVTAGLDDLELLDLRHLDPPPALGPKLIMIIATARSEKHLHVAADRFARWLRREHGLKANAAGLLGRNELKIKLRRKAKRMRMLANVGGTVPEGNIDDGIRTGWICCTLSKIEAHPDDIYMPGDNVENFVGFRDVKPGVNVVVQMFTEEKRAETDLETLWGGVLKTHQRMDKVAEDSLKDVDPADNVNDHSQPLSSKPTSSEGESAEPSQPVQQIRRPKPTPGDVFPSASSFENSQQLQT